MAPWVNRTSWRFGWRPHLGKRDAITASWRKAATSFPDLAPDLAPDLDRSAALLCKRRSAKHHYVVNGLYTRHALNQCYCWHRSVLLLGSPPAVDAVTPPEKRRFKGEVPCKHPIVAGRQDFGSASRCIFSAPSHPSQSSMVRPWTSRHAACSWKRTH